MFLTCSSFELIGQSSGQRARVTSRDFRLRQATGSVVRATDDSIAIELRRFTPTADGLVFKTDTLALPRAQIDRLEIRVGRGNRGADGAAIGGALGMAAGFIVGMNNRDKCVPDDNSGLGLECLNEPGMAVWSGLAGAAMFGLAGAGLGALIGSAIPGDKWEVVAIGALPGHPLGLGFAVSF